MQIPAYVENWLEVDLDAVCANAAEIRRHLPAETKLCAVVKADAYGLGAVEVARALQDKVDMLAVTSLAEAVELRRAEVKGDILVFTPLRLGQAEYFRRYRLTATVDAMEPLAELAEAGPIPTPCHIKLNTGMNRFGCNEAEALELARYASRHAALHLTGIYTHLANAAEKGDYKDQIKIFRSVLEKLKKEGIDYGIAHAANSPATLLYGEGGFDMVRCGTLLYGQKSVEQPKDKDWQLQDPCRFRARVLEVRTMPKSAPVGYGGDESAKKGARLAICGIGYADGLAVETAARFMSSEVYFKKAAKAASGKNRPYAKFNGQALPLLGRIAMQTCCVDISGTDIKVGDVLDFPLRRVTASSRLPRFYKQNGELLTDRDYRLGGEEL